MTLDLTLSNNWSKVISERRIAQYTQGDSSQANYKYVPLDPIYATLNSNVLLIGVQSNSAEKHWYLGARVSQNLYVYPSSTSNFIQRVKVSDQKRIQLNSLSLITFEDYKIYPYVLAIEIPYWLEDVYIEVWQYKEIYFDQNQLYKDITIRLNGIENRLERIENKLNFISTPKTNYSSQFDNPDSSASLGII